MRKIRKRIPKHLRKNKNITWFMSTEDFDIYDDVITEKPFKGADYRNMNEEKYKGIRIAVLSDLPKDVMFVTVASPDMLSNLWIGVNLADDANAIQIGKVANNGELFFFKMLMKADTNTVYGEDIVLWDGRGVAAPAGAPMGMMAAYSDGEPEFNTLDEYIEYASKDSLDKIAQHKSALVEKEQELADREKALLEREAAAQTAMQTDSQEVAKPTKAAIRKLNRKALEAFITDNKLSVEVAEGTTNAQLVEKIIEALGEEYFTETETGE